MNNGFIQISEPIFYKKDRHIRIDSKQRKMVCILQGEMILLNTGEAHGTGDVIGMDSLFNDDDYAFDLVALEDSAIIEIDNKSLDRVLKKNPEIFKEILQDTVRLLGDLKLNNN